MKQISLVRIKIGNIIYIDLKLRNHSIKYYYIPNLEENDVKFPISRVGSPSQLVEKNPENWEQVLRIPF